MARRAIQGTENLAKKIRQRRNELALTIEEAASRAGVGTKTWCRYEAGESIRSDKCKGICKALNWLSLPGCDDDTQTPMITQYRDHDAWSKYLEDSFGVSAATSFAYGSDILLDNIKEDLEALAALPIGSHIGQIQFSLLQDYMPKQFLMHYDYDFLFRMQCTLIRMRTRAKHGVSMIAHSVMEELLVYLCCEEATAFMNLCADDRDIAYEDFNPSSDWVFDLFDDMDIVTCLYSDMYISADHCYHFSHWFDQQFYMDTPAE